MPLTLQQRVKRLFAQQGQGSRIRRDGMPNGFFFRDLLWFGDSGSSSVAVSRGFQIVPGERNSLDDEAQDDVVSRLRVLLATLGTEYTLQAKFLVCSDYSAELEAYVQATESITDPNRHRWQVWNRTERYARYKQAMEDGKLRRQILIVYFTRVIEAYPAFELSERALAKHFDTLAARESLGFEHVQGDALQTLFPDCHVRILTNRDHFIQYYRFLNPSIGASVDRSLLDVFDPEGSIQENCLFCDIAQPPGAGISFQLDGYNHAILAMRSLPKRMGPSLISNLTELGFQDYELTLNIYPLATAQVVKKLEDTANFQAIEAKDTPKRAWSLGTQVKMAAERIEELERGQVLPVNVFVALRLWARDPETVISRAAVVKNAFVSMAGSLAHHATNPETARQLWYNTWPGWTYSSYRGYDLATDDYTAAELLPWTASFTGRLENAEALYDSSNGGLVGLSLQANKVPQHMLIYGIVGAGKSILLTDLWAQVAHLFDYKLLVEEGLSHGTTAQTAGTRPIVIAPGGATTINPFDCLGVPLHTEQLGFCVALCLQMLRETASAADPARVSRIESVLLAHINLLYDSAWTDWSRAHPQQALEVAARAYWIENHRTQMPGIDNTFLDAWSALRDQPTPETLDSEAIAQFGTHYSTRGLVRDLGMSYLPPESMPTLSQLVELMTLTPIGGDTDNPLAVETGDRLSVWRANGVYGKLFDGKTTARFDQECVHLELGLIPNSLEPMREAAHFLVLNLSRQQVIKRPRAQRKWIVFEEGARVLQAPGGAKALQEFYGQMRKFGAVVCTVFQQAAPLLTVDPKVRAAVIDNSKLILISAQPSPTAADQIANIHELSATAVETIKRYPLPENQSEGRKFSSFLMVVPDPRRKLVGTLRNLACPEVVYCGASDTNIWDERQKALAKYDDVVAGIITEARKRETKPRHTR
jgi:hypothetical protein